MLMLGSVPARLEREIGRGGRMVAVDISQLGRADSAGIYALLGALTTGAEKRFDREDLRRLAEIVHPALEAAPTAVRADHGITAFFERLGRAVVAEGIEVYRALAFAGQLILALIRTALRPRRLRLTPLVAVMEEAGLDGIPITVIMTFFIGAVVALVGVNILVEFGVSVFTVQMVGVAILREFGVVIAAILLAGRSASAFAAQIGAMRMNQEINAMQVMGVDLFDALVVPRVLAALLMMPLMTFCADIGGIVGGLLVSWLTLDISPVFFINRTLESVEIRHFWIGMSKAPFLAVVIAATGCRQGFMVEGDTGSLGRRVTAAVVQSVFLIIMFDAIFAMIFTELDL
ncbi:hypothetical protein K426_10210 [Sphingobium sp. TKS]|nr:hypothetical protein K426_10210 [Sphingobium sp. TKS]